MAQKITLRSKIDPEFSIDVGERVINSCTLLRNVQEVTNDNGEVCVEMSQKQLEKFVEFHYHFSTSDAEKDLEWSNQFFGEMTELEFKDLSFKADFLDSQRFLEAVGDFVLKKFETLDEEEIQRYLNVVDDYTPEERQAMNEHPLDFFAGVSTHTAEDGTQTLASAAELSEK